MTKPAADVFMSYKAEDRARLRPLVEALEADGVTVWWDADIHSGVDWRQDIQENLDAAKCVIVAWSKRSVGQEGRFVRDEASRAQRLGTYLPVRLDAVEPPLGFGEIQAPSLQGWKGDRSDPRYQAVIHSVRNRIAGEEVAHVPTHHAKPRVSRRTAVAGGIGIGAIAIAGTGGWLLLKPDPANAKRIAVFPFANLSGDQRQAYFSDGIAEELRSALSRVGLEVIGRSSSDAVKDLDTKAAAARLGVANILTGSVRRSPDTVRVNAQLVSGSDGVERWAQSYDRAPGDAIKIQTDIAANVAQALSIALGQAGRAALTLGGTADSIAQDLVLQSRKLRRESNGLETLRKGLALTDAAIARDSNYAGAFVERAATLAFLALNFGTTPAEIESQVALADKAASRALVIAPNLGSAHGVLAIVDLNRLRFPSALQHVTRALALSPDDLDVLNFATTLLPYLGQGQEALRLADRFITLDPLNPTAYRRKAQVLCSLGQYVRSIEAGRSALVLAPDGFPARIWTGRSLLLMGRHGDALAEYTAMPAGDLFRLSGEALVAARTGDAATAERLMAEIRKENGATASYQYVQIYSQLGQKDRAFAELDNAVASKDSGLVYLKVDQLLEPIRGDPRYAALVRKLDLP